MRCPTERATRGSQKWLQDVVNANGSRLADLIQQSRSELAGKEIVWLSPLREDEFAEYRDGSFLDRLGLSKHKPALRTFWPALGPQWDGLGKLTDGSAYFMIEAKANISEIVSNCAAKSPASLQKINDSLRKTQEWIGAEPHIDWTTGFYQYANRLAHLYFLNKIAIERAYLISLYFAHDTTHKPTEMDEWRGAVTLQKTLMGISEPNVHNFVIDVFLETGKIRKTLGSAAAHGRTIARR